MISIESALRLKKAGLEWQPAENDFFAIPFRELDERTFVISDMTVIVEMLNGERAITFNGASEWAMDYLIVTDAIWVPREDQLRSELERRLVRRGEAQPVVTLMTTSDGYCCEIQFKEEKRRFEDFGASECYAAALLFVLEQSAS
ncbi:MAG: pilus assembly protein CpaE [Anaerolineae bacterium]|jgi:hypothetical protein|nr:pilus assembly protein CpaE [Anaerolineae bacterium]